MFGVGTQEIIIILVIALVVFGPKKLPEIGKAIGQGLREIKKASRDIAESVTDDIQTEEPKFESKKLVLPDETHYPSDLIDSDLPEEYNVKSDVKQEETSKESQQNKEEAK